MGSRTNLGSGAYWVFALAACTAAACVSAGESGEPAPVYVYAGAGGEDDASSGPTGGYDWANAGGTSGSATTGGGSSAGGNGTGGGGGTSSGGSSGSAAGGTSGSSAGGTGGSATGGGGSSAGGTGGSATGGGGSSAGGTAGSATGGGGSSTGGGSATGGSATGGSTPIDRCTAEGTDGLIDDMEDGNNGIAFAEGRAGYWFSYHDDETTCTQTPDTTGGDEFEMTAGGESSSPDYAACSSGSGCTDWGAGIGFDFKEDPREEANCPGGYDASAFTGGISFCYKSDDGIRLKVVMEETADTGAEHGYDLTASSAWDCVSIDWSDITQPDWVEAGDEVDLDTSAIRGLQFQASQDQQPFDFCIDSLEFY